MIVSISYCILSQSNKSTKNNLYVLIFFLLSLFTLRERLLFRPHNLSYLFFALNLYLLLTFHKGKIFLLLLNQVFWVNTHNSFILGIINTVLLYPLINSREDKKRFFLILLATSAGSLLSPHFFKPFIEVFNPFIGQTKNIFKVMPVHEWQPVDLNLFLSFYGVLIIFSVTVIFFTKTYKILPFYLFYLIISIKFVRFIDYFALSSFFTALLSLENYRPIIENAKLKIFKFLIFVVILSACIKNYFTNPLIPYGLGFADFFYPKKAVDFIKKNNIKGNIFNSYPFGGYIIYNLYPDCRPIIDGRLCYPVDFIKLYADSLEDPYAFKNIISKYKPEIFLLDYNHPNIVNFLDIMKERYGLVYFDDNAMIFLERSNKFDGIIKAFEYKYVSPQYVMGTNTSNVKNLHFITQEILRNLSETGSIRSSVMLGNIMYSTGKKELAKEYFLKAIKDDSPIGKSEAYNNLGILYMEEDKMDLAVKMFKKAIFYTKDFDPAYFNLAITNKENSQYIFSIYYFLRYFLILNNRGEQINNDLMNDILQTGKLALKSLFEYFIITLALYGIIYIVFIKKTKNKVFFKLPKK